MCKKIAQKFIFLLSGIGFLLVCIVSLLRFFRYLPFVQDLYAKTIGLSIAIISAHRWLMLILALVALCISVLSFQLLLERRKRNILLANTELGNFELSTSAIVDMTKNAIQKFQDITPLKIHVKQYKNNIFIRVLLEFSTASNIPGVVSMVQKSVKEYVEDCTGLVVESIKINVKNSNDSSLKVYLAVKPETKEELPIQTEVNIEE